MPMKITNEMIARVCETTGASPAAVRRVSLGLASSDGDRQKIIDALIAAGADRHFLTELNAASGGRKAWTDESGRPVPTKQQMRVYNARGGSR